MNIYESAQAMVGKTPLLRLGAIEKEFKEQLKNGAKVDDLVYNDFFVGEDSDITIIAGCGIHTENGEPARHNGIHRFFIGKNAKVLYQEKHIGTGAKNSQRSIDPVTEAVLEEGSYLEMDTSQLGGVDSTKRKTPQCQKHCYI